MGRTSLTQLEVIERLTAPGSPGVLERWPGGFWTVPGMDRNERGAPVWYVGTQTVQSMERHGLLRRAGRYSEEWRDDRELTEAWLELGLGLAPNAAAEELAGLSRAELERMPTEELDRAAFGFVRDDVLQVPLEQIHIRYAADLEDAEYGVRTASQARKVLQNAPPVEVTLRDGALDLEDGHHRYVAARLLGHHTITAVVKDIADNPIDRILDELAPNARSARQLEAERAYAEGVRSTAQDKIRRHRTRIAELEAEKRTELSRIRGFERTSRARTVLEPATSVRGDRCYIAAADRQQAMRQEVDAFYEDKRLGVSEPLDAEEARLREDIERTRDITAIQTGRGRKAASSLRSLKRREAQQESDDAVERDIDASLVPVWRKVKRQFVDTPRMSRSEAFMHWVEEHPEEVAVLQEQVAMPTEESLEREQWSEEARAAVQSDDADDELPFN